MSSIPDKADKLIVYMCDDPETPVPTRIGHQYVYYDKRGKVNGVSTIYNIHDITDEELRMWANTQEGLSE